MVPLRPLAIAQLALCAVLLIGSIGPWVSAGFVSASGMEGDGIITLLCAFAIAGLTGLVLGVPSARRWAAWVAVAPAVLAVAVTIYDVINVSTTGNDEVFSVSVGWGLWLALFASLAMVVLAVLLGIESGKRPNLPTSAAAAPPSAGWTTAAPSPQAPSQAPSQARPGPPGPPTGPPPPPPS